MKLSSLIKEPIPHSTVAFIISQPGSFYQAQQVDYQPEILNLGVILLGYYANTHKVHRLLSLGNLLSVGHYLESPAVLKYGRNFKDNSAFQKLSAKKQKHLTDELQDGTIAFSRDLHHPIPLIRSSNFNQLIHHLPPQVNDYYFNHQQWMMIDNHSLIPLKDVIKAQLEREETGNDSI